MGLFEKKFCDICGNKIGLLGNRKLDDGNLCKDCASKLSPWFSDRRHSTVEQIRQQLEYREQNRAAAGSFNITRSIGKYHKLLIDDNNRKFTVSSGNDPLSSNPDILDFSQAAGCELKIDETRHELKRTVDGKQVSYNPPKYEYMYTFQATIRVNGNPYFDDMTFAINDSTVNTGEHCMNSSAFGSGWTFNSGTFSGTGENRYNECVNIGNEIKQAIDGMMSGGSAQAGYQQNAPQMQPAQPQPSPQPAVWTCPACGAEGQTGSACEYCGTPRA